MAQVTISFRLGGHDTLAGGTRQRRIFIGGGGNDKIYADGSFADGADRLEGGAGNDVYVVDGTNLIFFADPGYDRLEISASVSLIYANGTDVTDIEDITLTGTGAFNADGNGLDNIIWGNGAANILRGFGGSDTLKGTAATILSMAASVILTICMAELATIPTSSATSIISTNSVVVATTRSARRSAGS